MSYSGVDLQRDQAFLSLTNEELALHVERHPATVSGYRNGEGIPVEVSDRVTYLVTRKQRRDWCISKKKPRSECRCEVCTSDHVRMGR